ncbi:MAG: sensor domain-containing protein [Actinobacteria bacterium]|nr:sensor domain-containing protein [Actinomycetota bacterium]
MVVDKTSRWARVAGLTVAATLALAACSSGTSGTDAGKPAGSTGPAPSSTPTASTRTEAELKAVLLTNSDLPSGFTTVHESTPSSSATGSATGSATAEPPVEGGKDCALFGQAMQGDTTVEGATEASISFTHGTSGSVVDESLTSAPSAESARQEIAAFNTVFGKCKQFTTTESDMKITFKISTFKLPALGDDQVGVRLAGTVAQSPVTFNVDMLGVRKGDLLLMLVVTQPEIPGGPSGPAVNAASLLKVAYDRATR